MSTKVVTIGRHIIDQERLHPHATGQLSLLLYDLALAAKIISREVHMAGLIEDMDRVADAVYGRK